MSALLENIVAIVIVLGFVGCVYKLSADLRKEMREDIGKLRAEVREDIGKLDTKLDAKFDKLHDLMMKYIIDPAAAKQEAAAARQKEGGPKPPNE